MSQSPPPPKVERSRNVTIVTFTAGASRAAGNVIAGELAGTATDGGEHLLLDFTNVTSLNSEELGTLITLHKRARAVGGKLTLFNLRPDVLKLFTVSRLDTLLAICRERSVAAEKARGHRSTGGTPRRVRDTPAVRCPFRFAAGPPVSPLLDLEERRR